MAKEIHFSNEARSGLARGVQKLTDVVKVTMGPRGRNVMIHRPHQKPFLTKDGVTVAQEVILKDPLENMGAQTVKEASANTAYEAGDGTTTATVLTNAILQTGLKNVTAGADPVALKRGMENALEQIIKYLGEGSKEIGYDEIKSVATISANGDSAIGGMIAEAMKKVGRDGLISVAENNGVTDALDVVEGMKFERGYLSPHFINNVEKGTVELDNPFILMIDGKIGHISEILPVLQLVQQTQRPLLVISDEIEDDVLNTIIMNKVRGILNMAPVRAPGFGDGRKDQLKDIAISTGGKIASQATGILVSKMTLDDLGEAGSVIIDKDSTIIVSGNSDQDELNDHKKEIKSQISNLEASVTRDNLEKRLGKLSGGVAVIKVGAQTEFEMKERKDRVDDALAATKAAVAEGIVIGGGAALIKASLKVDLSDLRGDVRTGAIIIIESIKAPISQIAENAGYNAGVVLNEITKSDENIGFNAATGEYMDMFEAGIIDPLKVERIALTNAVSIASMLLTTEATLFEFVEPK